MTPTTDTLNAAKLNAIFVAWNSGIAWRFETERCIRISERYIRSGGIDPRTGVWS